METKGAKEALQSVRNAGLLFEVKEGWVCLLPSIANPMATSEHNYGQSSDIYSSFC